MAAICTWRETHDGESWETDCGNCFVFIVDGPAKNGMRYCCYCGESLVAVSYAEVRSDD